MPEVTGSSPVASTNMAKRHIFWGLFLGLVVFSLPLLAVDLAGSFSTTFGLGENGRSWQNTLTLRFSLAGWEVQSLTTWDGLGLQRQALAVARSAHGLSLAAGVVLKPGSPWTFAALFGQSFQVESGFVSVTFLVGNMTIRLTFVSGER